MPRVTNDVPGDAIKKIFDALHQVVDTLNNHTHGSSVTKISGTSEMQRSGSGQDRYKLISL